MALCNNIDDHFTIFCCKNTTCTCIICERNPTDIIKYGCFCGEIIICIECCVEKKIVINCHLCGGFDISRYVRERMVDFRQNIHEGVVPHIRTYIREKKNQINSELERYVDYNIGAWCVWRGLYV